MGFGFVMFSMVDTGFTGLRPGCVMLWDVFIGIKGEMKQSAGIQNKRHS